MSDKSKATSELVNELLDTRRTVSQLYEQVSELISSVSEQEQFKKQLLSNEGQFRRFVLSISDHIYVTRVTADNKFVNLYLSPQVEKLTGYSLTKLVSDWSFWPLHIIHPDDRNKAALQASRLARGENSEVEYRLVREDQQISWVRDSATVKISGNEKMVYGVVSDITEQKHRETAMSKLLTLSRLLISSQNSPDILDQAVASAVDIVLPATKGILQLFDESEKLLRTVAVSSSEKKLDDAIILNPATGIAGYAFAEKCVVNVGDVLEDSRFVAGEASPLCRSLLVAPLIVKDRCVGTLSLESRQVDAFSDANQDVAQLIADQIAISLENTRLFTRHAYAEASLQESEEKYASLTSQLPVGVYRTTAAGKFLYANAALASILGVKTVQELTQSPVVDFFNTPQEREKLLAYWKDCAGICQRELQLRTRDNRQIWVKDTGQVMFDANGEIIYIDGIIEDITNYKDVQEALAQNEARFRGLVQNISDSITVLDSKGIIKYVSPSVERIFGYQPDSLIGKNVCDFVDPDDQPKMQEQFQYILQRSGVTSPTEFRIQHVDGNWVWVESISNNLLNDPAIEGIVITSRDVTDRKEAEEQLKLLESQVRQSQKMEAVGRLAGGVAHDFNNLLTVISSYTEFLLDGLGPDNPLRDDVEQIRVAGNKAATLTRQLLVFSQQEIVQPQELDLNLVIGNVEKMLRRLISEDIELTTNLAKNLSSIHADPGQIEQVVVNLVVNASDAMPRGGNVTIETTNTTIDQSYIPRLQEISPGNYVQLTVKDTGVGMDEETLAYIFDPFFTTKKQSKGTGLGLSTVYAIVTQCGGDIAVYSAPGRGTTVRIYLPSFDESTITPEQVNINTVLSDSNAEYTILLVEDEQMVRKMTHRILTSSGYTVLEAAQGDEALQICSEYQGEIDLLLTDVVMPGSLNGKELVEQCAPKRPSMKVIFMSGYADDIIVKHGILETDLAFIQKPFKPDTLLRQIKETLENQGSGNNQSPNS